MNLPVFLTAFDPAELPGGSVDPLGLTTGYLLLADEFFPGMTAAAGQGTYFPMLCAGLGLYEGHAGASAKEARQARADIAQRLERLWGVACVLHAEERGGAAGEDGEEDDVASNQVPGLRGVTYVRKHRAGITGRETTTDFKMLAQQYRYGAIGIYSNVASALGLIDGPTLRPTVGFGEELGESFLQQTLTPAARSAIVRAARDPEEKARVRLDDLRTWGEKAFPNTPLTGRAATVLYEAVIADPSRQRMLALLAEWPEQEWSDEVLLEFVANAATGPEDARLRAALIAARRYDAFFRHVGLVLDRAIWLCRRDEERVAFDVAESDAELVYCGVLCEASVFDKRPSLRTVVHPVSVPGAVQHSKLVVLGYERAVRILLGSANLTAVGYRKNREVCGELGCGPEEPEEAARALDVLLRAREALLRFEGRAPEFFRELGLLIGQVQTWAGGRRAPAPPVLWSGGQDPLIEQFLRFWPAGAKVDWIRILSPFWSEDGSAQTPLRRLLLALRERGALGRRTKVELLVPGEHVTGGEVRPKERLAVFYQDLEGVTVSIGAVLPDVDPADLDLPQQVTEGRPLHAKVVVLGGGKTALGYAGSGNFTRRGFGTIGGAAAANIEAGWVFPLAPEQANALFPRTAWPVSLPSTSSPRDTVDLLPEEAELEICMVRTI